LTSEEDLGESLGGTNSNLREQLERAAARASFKPDDTFSDIDAIIAQKAKAAPVVSTPRDDPSSG
jgi:hypothetical protein